ncbi:hypothetical protein THF1C08_80118 [Vibrio jasicida]|jgi:hypothetical protein|nr:hypothetical protein THF1C08_80118 [Vibrio jasicida]
MIFMLNHEHDRNIFSAIITMFASRFISLHFETHSLISLEVFGQSSL